MPIIRSATRAHVYLVGQAIDMLRTAAEYLTTARCPKAAAKVRRAISSAEGARRHVAHRYQRTLDGDRVR